MICMSSSTDTLSFSRLTAVISFISIAVGVASSDFNQPWDGSWVFSGTIDTVLDLRESLFSRVLELVVLNSLG